MADESIYNLIPTSSSDSKEGGNNTSLNYKSTFADQVRADFKTHKVPGRNMGPPGGITVDPKAFLKTGQGIELRNSVAPKPEKQDFISTKPPVPRHNEAPVMASPSNKDYVKENLRKAVSVPARKVSPAIMDHTGARVLLEDSGLVPKYSSSGEYGKVPSYLERRNQENSQRLATMRATAQHEMEVEASRKMSEPERQELLSGLRANWNKLHHEYQGISVITDTIPKRTRKNKLEQQLSEIEADIQRIEKNKIIYIGDN